jgi:hypothetical protein
MNKVKYNDELEKTITAIFGVIGTLAIFANLYFKGFGKEDVMDAIKDLAGLVVVIAVFLVANKLFMRGHKFDFASIFESHLKDWINQNDYLVCDNFNEEGKGQYEKRYCSMVIDHSNLVTAIKSAKMAAQNKEKGAFVYLPYKDDTGNLREEFEFRFNERTFERQNHYKTNAGEVDLKTIIEQFTSRIDSNFRSLNIDVKPNPSNKTIIVSFKNMEHSEENAKKLIDIVEFVKTMVLALA